jgi:hypothetical protein
MGQAGFREGQRVRLHLFLWRIRRCKVESIQGVAGDLTARPVWEGAPTVGRG